MKSYNLGKTAEKIAANYLLAQRYKILEAHYYNSQGYHLGEIDLIAQDSKTKQIVFVEVKARKVKGQINELNQVLPEENITFSKIKKIIKTAEHYLRENEMVDKAWRIDGIAISLNFETRKLSIKHLKNIRL